MEIPYDHNAFDSELQYYEFHIPKGYIAVIEEDKVIIRKK